MNPERKILLDRRIERADNIIKFSLVGVNVFVLVSVIILISMVFNLQEKIRRDDAIQHARTQQYIRCIADIQARPIEQRQNIDFDDCSNTNTDAEDNPVSTPSTKTDSDKAVTITQPNTSVSTPATTSGGDDNDNTAAETETKTEETTTEVKQPSLLKRVNDAVVTTVDGVKSLTTGVIKAIGE